MAEKAEDHGNCVSADWSRAEQALAAGDLLTARRLYPGILRARPEHALPHARLGWLALLENDASAAVEHLAQALNLGERSRQTWSRLADAYRLKGELGSAAYCYNRIGRTALAGTLAALADQPLYRIEGLGDAGLEIPWIHSNPLPVVTAIIAGREANLVVDTGAGDLILDARFAAGSGIAHRGSEPHAFPGGSSALVHYGYLDALRLGGLSVTGLPLQVMPLDAVLGRFFGDRPIHGILGNALLAHFVTELDYTRARLRLSPSARRPSEPARATRADDAEEGIPFWIAGNLPLVSARLPGMARALFVLDSGMAGPDLALCQGTARALGIEARSDSQEIGLGGGGPVTGSRTRLPWIALDRRIRRQPEALILDAFPLEWRFGMRIHGLLGHAFMRDSRLRLDFGRMRLSLVAARSHARCGQDHPKAPPS